MRSLISSCAASSLKGSVLDAPLRYWRFDRLGLGLGEARRISCSSAGARRGATAVELAVVVTIIAVLVGLIVPAIQAAREAARRAQCVSNLRQVAIALNSYHSVHDMFTPDHLMTTRLWSTNRLSGFVFLLPHLEQVALYDAINMSFSQSDDPTKLNQENGTVARTVINTYLCPSDGAAGHRCSYRFNFGGQEKVRGGPIVAGPFGLGVLPRSASITDGLSRTAFLSERMGGSFAKDSVGFPRDVKFVPFAPGFYPGDDIYIPYCVDSSFGRWKSRSGEFWMYNGMEHTDYNHNGSPNDPRPSCGGTTYGLHPPRSFHTGLVNVLFGDGHVVAVQDSIDRRVWTAMGTPSRGD